MKISCRNRAELSMLLVALIWGTTFVLVKSALSDIGPFLFLGLRFLIAFGVIALLSYRSLIHIQFSTLAAGSLLGVFLFIGYIFQTVGLKYTTSSNAGFITGVNVVLVLIIYAILYRIRPAATTILTVVMAIIGLYFMSFQADTLTLSYGDLLVLVCAVAFALHIVFVDRYSHQHNPVAITAVQILFVGVVCLIIGLLYEPWPDHFTPNAVNAILITSVLATSLAFLLQNAMQKYSTPTRFAVILTMEPVFAALAGYLWAGEILSPRALAGAGLILLSMLVSIFSRPGKKQPKKSAAAEPNVIKAHSYLNKLIKD
ncbi:DMT family transporter [Syntrophomonas erecta]